MIDINSPDPLSAFTLLIVCLAVMCMLFAVVAAIVDHVISPWRERRRLDRLRAEIERELDDAMRRDQ